MDLDQGSVDYFCFSCYALLVTRKIQAGKNSWLEPNETFTNPVKIDQTNSIKCRSVCALVKLHI